MVAETKKNNSSGGGGTTTLKFLCSYGGKILPRSTDGKLRYVGGMTRVLSVDRSISFSELKVKLVEFCGYSVDLRCQLPNGDLEMLISVKSDEDLSNVVEEYDRTGAGKIRCVLSPPSSLKRVSPPSSVDLSPKSPFSAVDSPTASTVEIKARRRSGEASRCCCGCHWRGNFRVSYYNNTFSPYCYGHWH